MADLVAQLLGSFVGAVPERQPWRAIATVLYLVGAVVGMVVLVFLVTGAL